MKKPIRVLFLVGGTADKGLSPASRFRVYCYSSYFLKDNRFKIRIRPSIPAKHFHERPFIKGNPFLAKFLIPFGLLIMLITRLVDVFLSRFYDVVIIQRPLLPGKLYPLLEMLIYKMNRKIMFDFDDAIFVYHHEKSGERDNFLYRIFEDPKNVDRIIKRSAHVTVGNAFLADYAKQFNLEVSVVPTPIDVQHYRPRPIRTHLEDNAIIIGWIGTSGNLPYVEALAPVFRTLQERHDCELKIVCNPVMRKLRLDGVKYSWRDWTFDGELEDLWSFDIGIMPLPDNEWERGKCGFKLLQYMACGIPAVASLVGVNSEIFRDGENGFLAATNEEWVSKIEQLICDQNLRNSFRRRGRETVIARYSLDKTYPLLADSIIEVSRSNI